MFFGTTHGVQCELADEAQSIWLESAIIIQKLIQWQKETCTGGTMPTRQEWHNSLPTAWLNHTHPTANSNKNRSPTIVGKRRGCSQIILESRAVLYLRLP